MSAWPGGFESGRRPHWWSWAAARRRRVGTLLRIKLVTATFAERLQATIQVPNADGLAAVAGALWVKTDDGRVVRIDPATNKVTGETKVDAGPDPDEFCVGIGTDGTALWSCATGKAGTDLVRIDPQSRRAVLRVSVGKVFDQLALPVTDRGAWALTADGRRVSVADPATGRVASYPLGDRSLQLAADGDRVVATSVAGGSVTVLDAATGQQTGRVSLPDARLAVIAGQDIWVDARDGLTRIGPDLAAGVADRELGTGANGDLVATAGAIWLRTSTGTITKVDPATGHAVERLTPETPLRPGSLLVAFGSIWASSGDDGTVIRLRTSSG